MERLDFQPATRLPIQEAIERARYLTANDEDGWVYKVAIYGDTAGIDVYEDGERLGSL